MKRMLLTLLLSLAALPAQADSAGFGPWDLPGAPLVTSEAAPTRPSPPRGETLSSISTSPFFVSFKFYQRVLSPIDGPRCAHRPTCSMYGIQAMKKHPLMGPFLTIDRLWRSGDSSAIRRLSLTLGGEGQLFFRDPVEDSDFWFTHDHP